MSDDVSAVVVIGGYTDNVEAVVTCSLNSGGNPVPTSLSNPIPTADHETNVALGRITGRRFINKFGRNSTVDSVPEDLWNGGGLYTGFPTSGSAETLSIVSSNTNDTAAGTGARSILVTGLDGNYAEISETVTLNGTTPVTTTQTFWRMHTANIRSAGSLGFNQGEITIRHSTTTANIFSVMPIGRNQTNAAVYTVPAGYTGILHRLNVFIRSANSSRYADGELWVRQFGFAARLRRPWTINSSAPYYSDLMGGLVFPEKTDITIRVSAVSTSPSDIIGEFDIEIIANS